MIAAGRTGSLRITIHLSVSYRIGRGREGDLDLILAAASRPFCTL
jgi:hypothetical protein